MFRYFAENSMTQPFKRLCHQSSKASLAMITLAFLGCRAPLQQPESKSTEDWYKDRVFYHLWVPSFADSDGDGRGDLKGIIQNLDYLNDGDDLTTTDLGVDGIWLSPFFESKIKSPDPASNMHGYDIVDYYQVNSLFGTKDDLRELLTLAQARGIKVIFDFVPNHTSDAHPWFQQSVDDSENKGDWYVWTDEKPREWNLFSGDPWHESKNGRYYYGTFWHEMPDLNLRNEDVRNELKNILRYWLDFGFDGLRVDAARYLFENGPDSYTEQPETFAFFEEIRREVLEPYSRAGDPKMMIAEVWENAEIIREYYGTDERKQFHMALDFPFASSVGQTLISNNKLRMSDHFSSPIYLASDLPPSAENGTFLNNHDGVTGRPISFYRGDRNKARAAAALNILTPGTPFIYYGNEIGSLADTTYGDGDIRHRSPFSWDQQRSQNIDPGSILSWYRNLIRVRQHSSSLRTGSFYEFDTNSRSIFAYAMSNESEDSIVVFNLSSETQTAVLDFTGTMIPDGPVHLVLGAPGAADAELTANNRSSFDIRDIPRNGFRVYQLGYSPTLQIPRDVNTYIVPDALPDAMYVRGSMNGWGKAEMTLENGIWELRLELKPNVYQFKFDKFGDWSLNWGDDEGDGIGEPDGENIEIEVEKSGTYLISFDEDTYEYGIEKT